MFDKVYLGDTLIDKIFLGDVAIKYNLAPPTNERIFGIRQNNIHVLDAITMKSVYILPNITLRVGESYSMSIRGDYLFIYVNEYNNTSMYLYEYKYSLVDLTLVYEKRQLNNNDNFVRGEYIDSNGTTMLLKGKIRYLKQIYAINADTPKDLGTLWSTSNTDGKQGIAYIVKNGKEYIVYHSKVGRVSGFVEKGASSDDSNFLLSDQILGYYNKNVPNKKGIFRIMSNGTVEETNENLSTTVQYVTNEAPFACICWA